MIRVQSANKERKAKPYFKQFLKHLNVLSNDNDFACSFRWQDYEH